MIARNLTLNQIATHLEQALALLRQYQDGTGDSAACVNVPYRSQWDTDAGDFQGDCGPACIAMMLDWTGGPKVAIDALAHEAGITDTRQATNASDLIRVAVQHGLRLRQEVLTLDGLREELRQGRPAVVLVNYAQFGSLRQDTAYNGTHWCVVVGFGNGDVMLHDPDHWGDRRLEGNAKQVSVSVFDAAWASTLPNGKPRQALVAS